MCVCVSVNLCLVSHVNRNREEILKQPRVYSFLYQVYAMAHTPGFTDIWSKLRLNYDYANFAESYILHSSHLYLIFCMVWPKTCKTMHDDDDDGGPISNLIYKHNLQAGWFGGPEASLSWLLAHPDPIQSYINIVPSYYPTSVQSTEAWKQQVLGTCVFVRL